MQETLVCGSKHIQYIIDHLRKMETHQIKLVLVVHQAILAVRVKVHPVKVYRVEKEIFGMVMVIIIM